MLRKYLRFLVPCKSFGRFKLSDYANIPFIIKGLLIAFLLSAFIFLRYFQIDATLINTFMYPLGVYLLLVSSKEVFFWSGFFIGILWFYWIGFSFEYYGFSYLIPVVILAIGLVYGVVFFVISYFTIYTRASIFVLFSYFHPFGFNWFKFELGLTDSYLAVDKVHFLLLMMALVLVHVLRSYKTLFALIPLALSMSYSDATVEAQPLKIKTVITHVPQEKRWDIRYQQSIIDDNFYAIDKAINENYDVVVLPESAFPLLLDKSDVLIEALKERSSRISIITGGISEKEDGYYNSAFYFIEGKMHIVNKVYLVPFGEEIPLPRFLARMINEVFFEGAEDYKTAKKPSDVMIKGIRFRNAICFEATKKEMYIDAKVMIAMSNNAWFGPSTQGTLQNILFAYYKRLNGTVVYHSYNY